MGALQQTYFREISYCNNDLETWRYRYNCERPHESLRGLTPLMVYFQYRRHKKHYDL
jgi:transposase InsO family protein